VDRKCTFVPLGVSKAVVAIAPLVAGNVAIAPLVAGDGFAPLVAGDGFAPLVAARSSSSGLRIRMSAPSCTTRHPLVAGDGFAPLVAGSGLAPLAAGRGLAPLVAGDGLGPRVAGSGLAPLVADRGLAPLGGWLVPRPAQSMQPTSTPRRKNALVVTRLGPAEATATAPIHETATVTISCVSMAGWSRICRYGERASWAGQTHTSSEMLKFRRIACKIDAYGFKHVMYYRNSYLNMSSCR
jgi:hypothetical protein